MAAHFVGQLLTSCQHKLPTLFVGAATGVHKSLHLSSQVPDTPEDEGGLDVEAGAEPGSGELLRQTLRKSVEKARRAAAASTAPGSACPTAATGGLQAPALTKDLTNQQQPAVPAAPVLLPAPTQHPSAAAGATPTAPQQQRRPTPPATFLAGVKAALQEASAGGTHAQQAVPAPARQLPAARAPEVMANGSALSAALRAALAPRQQQTATTRGRQAPQLVLQRSPHEAGEAAKHSPGQPTGLPAAAPTDLAAAVGAAERTPQAQLGLRPVPGAEVAPATGRTDGSGKLFPVLFSLQACDFSRACTPLVGQHAVLLPSLSHGLHCRRGPRLLERNRNAGAAARMRWRRRCSRKAAAAAIGDSARCAPPASNTKPAASRTRSTSCGSPCSVPAAHKRRGTKE